MTGIGDQTLQKHHRIPERPLRLALSALQGDVEFVRAEHLTDPAAPATTTGLDDQRIADLLGVTTGILAGLDGATAPRRQRNAHLLGQQFGFDLVTQRAHRRRRRPDEHQPQPLTQLGERHILSDETPPHPHRISPGLEHRALQNAMIQVGDTLRGLTQHHRLIGLAHEHRPTLRVGMQRHSPDATVELSIQLPHRPNQPHRGLTPINHRNTLRKRDC